MFRLHKFPNARYEKSLWRLALSLAWYLEA